MSLEDPYAVITQGNVLEAFNHAVALQAQGRHEDARRLWERITAAAPTSAEARFNLGVSLFSLERFEEAEAAFRRAIAMKPEAPWAHQRLGNLLHAVGRWTEAEEPYRTALSLQPQNPKIQLDLGHLYLGLGDYERGWPLYEARKDVPAHSAERLPMPGEWQGEPLEGRSILIWREQGLGDMIQFARFAPILAAQGAKVSLVTLPPLMAMFESLGVELIEHRPEMTLPQPDYWTLPLSIPRWLGVTAQTVPAAPYLSVPEDRRRKWAGYAPKGAVGVIWRGNPQHPNDRHRSLPTPDLLAPLREHATLIDLQEPLGDFADLAAVIEQLDLLITVDTAPAHLAGAMGKPVWVMLPWFRTDWRWMGGRPDTPWYPSMRLFRQPRMGDWDSVVAEVTEALAQRRT